MPKGMFTQGISVLLERPVSLDEMEGVLGEFDVRKRVEASEEWSFGGPALIVVYDLAANGLMLVDTVDHPWPDHMGNPKTEPMVFGAWSMGHFGPFAFPGSLQRAAQQSWVWEAGRTVPDHHCGFIRVRSSYAFGADQEDSLVPEDYEPLPEIEFATKLATALLQLPAAVCYFNPNGEVLRDQDGLRQSLNYGWANELPPLDVWSNIRLFNVNEQWSLMDTVGNSQLDMRDVEACFNADAYDFGEVDNFLRNVTLYLLNHGEVIEDGDTIDGPGEIRWQAQAQDESLCDPPRPVLRLLPQDDRPLPAEIADTPDD